MRIRMPRSLAVTAALALALGLSACGTDPAPDPGPVDGAPAATEPATEPDSEAVEADSYEERLTPVATIRKATSIEIDGPHARVTVPEASTDTMSVLVCLQLLPARMDGETLTVIYSDGVEEVCEWPEDD